MYRIKIVRGHTVVFVLIYIIAKPIRIPGDNTFMTSGGQYPACMTSTFK